MTITCTPPYVGYLVEVELTGASDGLTMIQENNNTIATIGGTPAVAGTCTVTCVVTDGHGNSVTATPIDLVISGAVKMVAPKKVESAPAQSPKVEAPKPVAPAAPVADK